MRLSKRCIAVSITSSTETQEINLPEGKLKYGWKYDLPSEEGDPNYLPEGVDRVLELKWVESNTKGGGTKLMEAFLQTSEAKAAEMIMLDLHYDFSDPNYESVKSKLIHFYKKFNFRSKNNERFWLTKLPIETSELPT